MTPEMEIFANEREEASTGILLFAHGSRDPVWRAPFERVLSRVSEIHPGPVALAFLEHMRPDFMQVTEDLTAQGATRIRVVPLFLAAGGHVRQCIPDLIEQARGAYPSVLFECTAPLGENERIIDALTDIALNSHHLTN